MSKQAINFIKKKGVLVKANSNCDNSMTLEGQKATQEAMQESSKQTTDEMKRIFEIYDGDQDGRLTYNELKCFVDDIRKHMCLSKTDKPMFTLICDELEADENSTVSDAHFFQNLDKMIPIICEADKYSKDFIDQIFIDYDLNKNGQLDKSELQLFMNLHCDKLGVTRATQEQVNQIMAELDIDNNGCIDRQEMIYGYSFITKILDCNQKKARRQRKRTSIFESTNPFGFASDKNEKSESLVNISKHAIMFVRQKKLEQVKSAKSVLNREENLND